MMAQGAHYPVDELSLYSEPVSDTLQPNYCNDIDHQTKHYTQLIGATPRKLPKLCRPTNIAPGYPWIPGKDSIPRTPQWCAAIPLHPNLAAGIHLSSGGEHLPYNHYNPPKGTWLSHT
ncbi:hypothetical protein EB796_001651 [Bugula neritina]|uniref:Uncharacterized protein n=1 Tax=Bugula neritina TaxID=10212 RepID=A0A7J7KPD9_BUGNE|nr:hypothetical protein EB796_001651 [Bugula neritina]